MKTKDKSTVLDAFQFEKRHCNDLSSTFNFIYSFIFFLSSLRSAGMRLTLNPRNLASHFFSFNEYKFMNKGEVCTLDKHHINFPPAIEKPGTGGVACNSLSIQIDLKG